MTKLGLDIPGRGTAGGPGGYSDRVNSDFVVIESKGHYVVRADGDGVALDTAAFLDVFAEATPGSVIDIPEPEVEYLIDQAIPVPAEVTVRMGGHGCVIRQTVWGYPIFDLFDVDGCTIDSFRALFTGTKEPPPHSSFRGDDRYTYMAAVYTNGSHHTIDEVFVEGFPMGVTLSNWDSDAAALNGQRDGNTVKNFRGSGLDHGVLFYAQRDLNIRGLRNKDSDDSSAGANPTHSIYATNHGWSERVHLHDCLTENDADGDAYVLKQCKGVSATKMVAEDSLGLFSIQQVQGGNFAHLVSRRTLDKLGITGSDVGALVMQDVSETGLKVSDVFIEMTAPGRAATLRGDDSEFDDLVFFAQQGGGYDQDNYAVTWTGDNARMGRVTIHNKGAGTSRGLLMGGGSGGSSYLKLAGPYTAINLRNAGDVLTGTTLAVVKHDPALCELTDSNLPAWGQAGGAVGFTLDRAHRRQVPTISGAGTVTPDPTTADFIDVAVGTTAAVTIAAPSTICPGLVVDIAILNNSGGALNVTWNATYHFKTSWSAPSAGARVTSRFFYDGSNWIEIGRY